MIPFAGALLYGGVCQIGRMHAGLLSAVLLDLRMNNRQSGIPFAVRGNTWSVQSTYAICLDCSRYLLMRSVNISGICRLFAATFHLFDRHASIARLPVT